MQIYLWMLNAMNDDRKLYLDRYVLNKLTDYNFGPKAPRPQIIFRKLGNTNAELLNAMLTGLMQKDKIKLDVKELGQMAGMTIEEIEVTTADPASPTDPAPAAPNGASNPAKGSLRGSLSNVGNVSATGKEIEQRVRGQVELAFKNGTFGKDFNINMGFKRRFEKELAAQGVMFPIKTADDLFSKMDNWIADVVPLGMEEFSTPDNFLTLFNTVLENEISQLVK
jgi:hypothetical protein